MLFTETWSSDLYNYNVKDFKCITLHRTEKKLGAKRDSGGLILYLRSYLYDQNLIIHKDSDDIIWLGFNPGVLSADFVFLGLCYVLPTGTSREPLVEFSVFDRLLNNMAEFKATYSDDCSFIVCGDMNARTGILPDMIVDDNNLHVPLPEDYTPDDFIPRTSQDKVVNSNGYLMLNFCKQSSLRILNGRCGNDGSVGRFTFNGHAGQSVVDYILVSKDLLDTIISFSVADPNILSDHCAISCSMLNSLSINESQSDEINEHCEKIYYKYKWNETDAEEFKCLLSSDDTIHTLNVIQSDFLSVHNDNNFIDNGITKFVDILEHCGSPFYKHIFQPNDEPESNHKNQPWYTDVCREKKSIFYERLNRYRNDKTELNRLAFVTARSDFKSTLRNCRFEYNQQQTYKLTALKYRNAKDYWKLLKSAYCESNPHINLSDFARYFKAVNNPEDPFYSTDEDSEFLFNLYLNGEIQIMFDELNKEISLAEIISAISQLKNGKSSGPDRLINEFFINGKDILTPYLHTLFNVIFDKGYFPDSWSLGEIIPIHKKGSKANVENYRGITLLSVLGKLFTRILNNRLTSWAENYGVYIEAQAGFRQNMSTVDNVFILNSLISHSLNANKQLYCSFIDFSKAFDYVVRDILWHKLLKFGVRGKILDIIVSMCHTVKSKVKYNNYLSEEFTCQTGVRQGECLSPFLFSIYVNDIEEEFIIKGANGIDVGFLKLFLLLYADDIVIFSDSPEGLQKGLDILYDYCKKWKLSVNIDKSKIMIFRKGGRIRGNLSFKYGDIELEIVPKFTYLGIVFTSGGSYNTAQNTLSDQARKAIFILSKYLTKFVNVPPSHVLELFDKLISPILCYGSEVWGFNKGKDIEKVHLQFCKRILAVKQCTQNDFVYGELGRTTFQNKHYLNIIKYWIKVTQSSNVKYISIAYDLLLSDLERYPNKTNWASQVRDLLCDLGFSEAWLNQPVADSKLFIALVKQRLNDTFIQNWNSRINESSRALFYRNFNMFCFKPYLDSIKAENIRHALTRLRTSSHRLEIEVGRWAKPESIPVHQRLCLTCNLLEDEFHFVLQCNRYNILRSHYINSYFYLRPNMHKFIELMTSTNENTIKNLALYVKHAFKERQKHVFQ